MALADWLKKQLEGLVEGGNPRQSTPGPNLALSPNNLVLNQQKREGTVQDRRPGPSQPGPSGPRFGQDPRARAKVEKGMKDLMGPFYKPGESTRPNLVEDPSAGMGGENPFAGMLTGVSESYDEMIAALGGLGPIYKEQAQEAQGRIGGFFDYAKGTAEAGRAPTRETYETASQNVNSIYDELGSRLGAAPQQAVDTAARAGGGANATSVADRVAAATAPFQAAGETGRANALANLTQHSAAGQDYLTQLASATGGEAAMHQSAIEGALNQQLQGIAFKQAELEGAKQRALAEISADVAGDASERMANAAMAQALGLDIPEGLDPGEFLMNRNRMAEFQGKGLSQQQAALNLAQDQDPMFQERQVVSSLSSEGQRLFSSARSMAEEAYDPALDSPEELGFQMLAALDDLSEQGEVNAVEPGLEDQIREAIRSLYMG